MVGVVGVVGLDGGGRLLGGDRVHEVLGLSHIMVPAKKNNLNTTGPSQICKEGV